MKRTITISLSAICLGAGFMSADVLTNTGQAGKTGSPGESTCISCHSSFAINSGGGSITISSSPAFTGGQYIPGTVYTITVTVSHTGSSVFGLGVEALTSSNTNAGTLAITIPGETHILTSSGRTNVVHKLNGGLTSNSKAFAFQWTAPASGNVTFYAAGIGGNHNGSDTGDYVYNTSLSLTAGSATGISEAALAAARFNLYPNPVSDRVNVSYTLDNDGPVKCMLYSLDGRLVQTLMDEQQAAGEQSQSFELPAGLTKGIYLVQMNIEGKTACKKMIVQ